MVSLKTLLWVGILCSLLQETQGQALPAFSIDRRMDNNYIDSLSRLGKQRYHMLASLPQTAHNDTLRFKTLYFLGKLYKWWIDRRDSTVYYSQELIQQAHKSNNLYYEVNGKFLLEEYYHKFESNTPLALHINFEILALLKKADTTLTQDAWMVNMNLGSLYGFAKDYDKALQYLSKAQQLLVRNTRDRRANVAVSQMGIEQNIAAIYDQKSDFLESEKHYLRAINLLSDSLSASTHGYIYGDIARLYLKYGRYNQALDYANKAEASWSRVKTLTGLDIWGALARIHSKLGQDELAVQYAQKVVQSYVPARVFRAEAYMALHEVYEHRQDWKNSIYFYKRYVALRDSMAGRTQGQDLAIIQKQNEFDQISQQKKVEFDRITLQHEHTRQLQAERLLVIQKQSELNELRTNAITFALKKKAQLGEQQRQLDNERAKAAQRQQQQAFDLLTLQQKEQDQQHQFLFLATSSLLVLGVLILLLYSVQLRNRKVKAELRLSDERKEANARIIQAQEEERQRLAADLHDDLGATLSAIKGHLGTIHQSDNELNYPIKLMERAIQDLRHISHNLMPPEFGKLGLTEAIRETVRRAESGSDLHFLFITYGQERRLANETELTLYRIAIELINNAIKHAKAQQITIQLIFYPQYVSLLVEDDGRGYPTQGPRTESGIGLRNIRSRVTYLKSTLLVDSGERGTTVTVDVPF